jgi:hypothetical protein
MRKPYNGIEELGFYIANGTNVWLQSLIRKVDN